MNKLEKSIQFVAKHYKRNAFNPDFAWEKVTRQPKRVLFRPAVWRSAAVVAVVLVVVGTFLLRPAQDKVLTAHKEQKISIMPDKSTITLKSNAILSYAKNFGKENRNVSLAGNAKFEVARNENLPFIVQTSQAEITVLGTVFNVENSENQTNLEVLSGKVLFEPHDFPVTSICTKDMSVAYNSTEKEFVFTSPESGCTINQKNNLLKFSNMQLAEVARILTEYYGQEIFIEEKDSDLRLTSTFENKNIWEILEVINLTLETKITAS